jgi:hypothetical protein
MKRGELFATIYYVVLGIILVAAMLAALIGSVLYS